MIDQLVAGFENNDGMTRAIIVLAVTLVASLVSRFMVSGLVRRSSATKTPWDDAFARSLSSPLRLLVWVVGLSLASKMAGVGQGTPMADVITAARDIGVIVSIAWFLIRFIKRAQTNLVEQESRNGKKIDKSAADGIGKLLRLIVIIAAGLVAMQTLGFSIAGILTFGGVGGIAIGFAAQDMLSNFFGGLMIYLDRPFKTGDWIRSPDREIEGVVEEIGWRVTLIRNFDSRPLYVPNSTFSTISIENVSRMTNRKIYETIGIRYDDAAAIDRIVEQVTAYLKGHEELDQEQTLMVSFNTFAPSSLDFFIYCYTKTQSGPVFYRIKQEIMLHILEIIEENGAECAFPTTTVHMLGGATMSDSQAAKGAAAGSASGQE